MQELYLERNRIGSEGATCIARLLCKDGHLKIVSLAHNPIGSLGAMALASSLEQNRSLDRLDLSYCDIDDLGVQKLAQSLKHNTTLKYLKIEGNPISSDGVYSLFKCIYDTSDGIHSIWDCNHTIRGFHGQHPMYSPSFPETNANKLLVKKLTEILATCNRRYYSALLSKSSRKIAASRKILRYYFKDEKFEYISCLEETEEKLVPNVIGWLSRYGDVGIVYEVVRDMPWLVDHKRNRRKKDSDSGDVAMEGDIAMVSENVKEVESR